MRRLTACGLVSLLAACAGGAADAPRAVAWFRAEGENAIEGRAALLLNGGALTCAGFEAALIPASDAARRRMLALYGSEQEGFLPASGARAGALAPPPRWYRETMRTAPCSTGGGFTFSALPDGDYYVVAQVTWTVAGSTAIHGGFLMRRVSVADGAAARLSLSHDLGELATLHAPGGRHAFDRRDGLAL